MIFAGSRYATYCVEAVPDSHGTYHATLYPGNAVSPVTGYTLYQVKPGDRLDTIAALALGDSELWWRVADANPGLIYPDSLTPGMVIVVPGRAGV